MSDYDTCGGRNGRERYDVLLRRMDAAARLEAGAPPNEPALGSGVIVPVTSTLAALACFAAAWDARHVAMSVIMVLLGAFFLGTPTAALIRGTRRR